MVPHSRKHTTILPGKFVRNFGHTLIVAPHADDESLGCGGLIALLSKYRQPVHLLLVSDGTLSHPNSKEYPAEKLRDLREYEFKKAAAILGVTGDQLIFTRYKDRSVPHEDSPGFQKAVDNIDGILSQLRPASIFVPWRRDPHPDHRATWQIFNKANRGGARLYEYPIWLQQLGDEPDLPTNEEVDVLKIDISPVLEIKQKAIAAHQSQLTDLISDDPAGFRLSPDMLDQFNVPYEMFFTAKK
ncbi:MAG TPA: PIG-L family deacetylase [Chryseobacterium sp.]|nr:PIG-L family deacetylase [Chryseobacterium sp.]